MPEQHHGTMTTAGTGRPTGNHWLRFGFIADGCFKLLVAAALPPLSPRLGAQRGLALATSTAVASSGIAEIAFGVRSGAGSHTRHLAAYDSGWLAVTGVAAALATRGSPHGGRLWLGYQAAASVPLALVFAAGVSDRPSPPA